MIATMFNRTIKLDSLASAGSWLLGLFLSLGDLFGFMPEDSGYVGLAFINLGLWVGTMRAISQLDERERVAFDLGRKAGAVRSIR